MLTRLRVRGFKNLLDVDVRFGPFTCIAGPNGVGKSNLFDAIHFLSLLADHTLLDAALSIRTGANKSSNVRALFHRSGQYCAHEMSFDAEMVVPKTAQDELGQMATASITLLRYSLTLAFREGVGPGNLEIRKEELGHLKLSDASQHLRFENRASWRKSALVGRRSSPFISTESQATETVIKLHQDRVKGRPLVRKAGVLPRTVLSAANAAESPTALVAKREMQSWRLLQLEPSALRRPDELTAPTRIGTDGSHLPATLFHLATVRPQGHMYGQVALRLSELIEEVSSLWVQKDDRRELLSLHIRDFGETEHEASALSDGTLRFLALAVLEASPGFEGAICLEEPENGIHPKRIPAMIRLLQDIACDTAMAVSDENPLRQVIVNTHSPSVVQQVPVDSLLVAKELVTRTDGHQARAVRFGCVRGTWRAADRKGLVLAPGDVLDYLSPVSLTRSGRADRVVDSSEFRQLSLFHSSEQE